MSAFLECNLSGQDFTVLDVMNHGLETLIKPDYTQVFKNKAYLMCFLMDAINNFQTGK